jgi:hypothetical protein
MNEAYKNMRGFWLDAENVENKKGVKGAGKDDIYIAGVEFSMPDHDGRVKNIIVAASVLGDASMYFENNSKSGIGGFIGGGEDAKKITAALLREAAALAPSMQSSKELNIPSEPGKVTLFAVTKGKIFFVERTAAEVSAKENDFFKFFSYTQQLISAFRAQDDKAHKAKEKPAN